MFLRLTLAVFTILSLGSAQRVPWCGPLAGPGPCKTTIWAQVGGALDDINRANTEAARQMGARVGQARRKFWQAYPNGPGFAQAQADFAAALAEKDAYLCKADILLSNQSYSRDGSGTKLFREGVNPDGGIPSFATPFFHNWTRWVNFEMNKIESSNPFDFQARFNATPESASSL